MKRRRRGLTLLLLLGGTLAGLLLGEAALRVAGFSFQTFDAPDEHRGVALRAGAEGFWRKEGGSHVRINSEGLRDVEHAKQKPPGTLRVAVLGDSYAEALQVPLEETFWRVMGRRLSSCGALGGRQVEVINFGVSGYQTAQELVTLRRHVWDYSPDVVVLAVTTSNDIRDNSPELAPYPHAPFGVYRDGALSIDSSRVERRNNSASFRLRQSAAGRLFQWLRDRSRVVQLIDRARLSFGDYAAGRPGEGGNRQDEPGLDEEVYREPDAPARREAWRVTEGLITLMRDEVSERGARLYVVTLSNSIQVNPDRAARQAYADRLGVADLFYPDRRIGALCERERIPVLNLAPVLQAHADRTGVFLHGFGAQTGKGHWNAEGHRLAGELIAQKLCENSPDVLSVR